MKVVVYDNGGEFYVMPDTVLLRDGEDFFMPDYGVECGEEVVRGVAVRITRIAKHLGVRFANRAWQEHTECLDHRIVGLHHTLSRCFDRSFEVGTMWHDKSTLSPAMVDVLDRAVSEISTIIQLRVGDYVFVPEGAF